MHQVSREVPREALEKRIYSVEGLYPFSDPSVSLSLSLSLWRSFGLSQYLQTKYALRHSPFLSSDSNLRLATRAAFIHFSRIAIQVRHRSSHRPDICSLISWMSKSSREIVTLRAFRGGIDTFSRGLLIHLREPSVRLWSGKRQPALSSLPLRRLPKPCLVCLVGNS